MHVYMHAFRQACIETCMNEYILRIGEYCMHNKILSKVCTYIHACIHIGAYLYAMCAYVTTSVHSHVSGYS